ncbi:MAG: DUF58 domain-containing protein [Deltaproteobacteria bacterium]|nr:DUF58 domain-containing protein [Deltaproteobacteria bacterium]
MSLDAETIRKIRKIHIITNYLVNDIMTGEYHSAFKGLGMEFAEVREYQPGDDIRTIDWNVTARTGRPFVKSFQEERELTVMLLVDISASGSFGTFRTKNEVAAEIAATLSFSAIKNQDKVGLLLFTDRVEKYIPPRKGRSHVWRVIEEVLEYRPEYRGTDLSAPLEYINRVLNRKTICFLLSDFLAAGFERPLRVACRRHDMIAVTLTDPRETVLPAVGYLKLLDAETGEILIVNTRDPETRRTYTDRWRAAREKTVKIFRSLGIDHIEIRTDRPYVEDIMRFFRLREKRRTRIK